jgi:prostaglandin-endoperoxide synthase 2
MKLVVEDYINHILGHKVFKLDHEFAEEQHWYRANWIALEFDMLYRWHGLVPDALKYGGDVVPANEFRSNNALLEKIGVGPLIASASTQAAGKIGLGNTPEFLWGAEYAAIKMSRTFRVRPYNEYRELFGLPKMRDFDDLTKDVKVAQKLEKLYGHIDRLEFLVGLFGEDATDGGLFGDLLNHMVAYDAFTQIFSNPLLSRNVYGPETFTDYGVELIEQTTSVEALVNRNVESPVKASLGV